MPDLAGVDISIVRVNDDRGRLVVGRPESLHADPPAVQEWHRVGANVAVRMPNSVNRVLIVNIPVATIDADLAAVVVAPRGVFDRCAAVAR